MIRVKRMDIYYCGFNGFKQVPVGASSDTLTCLTLHTRAAQVVDVAVCWNYLVVADTQHVTKYGLVNNKPGLVRLEHPPGGGGITQISATPRHILSVTTTGECWTHEEGKGWRRVLVETEANEAGTPSDDTAATASTAAGSTPTGGEEALLPHLNQDTEPEGADNPVEAAATPPENQESPVRMRQTACGDYHNLGLDSKGQAYSLPSPLHVTSFPGAPALKVTDVACGKEHCMLLTEYGQVYTWGGGTRGQLGHGSLSSEVTPRLVVALDGMKVKKIAAGGWHSAAISEFSDLYMFGWNESGQLALPTNLARPAECFSAVEKLLMACCTMQAEDAAIPRGDTEDTEVYRKHGEEASACEPMDPEKEMISCYTPAACENSNDYVMVQPVPILVPISGKNSSETAVVNVGCGSRHTVCLTQGNCLWSFGWNKYGQLGLGDTKSRDQVCRMPLPRGLSKTSEIRTLRCGDWGTAIVLEQATKKSK